MTRSLMSYLPYVLRDYTEIQAILVGQQPELDQVWEAAESLLENQFIVSAEGLGLGRWEKILGITPKGTDSLEDRRFRILARWNEELPYTIKQLRAILETLCGAGNYTAEMDGAYTLSVKVGLAAKSSFADVQAMLERITPQNLVLALSQLYNTWNEAKRFTWNRAKTMTWKIMREEVLPE